MWLRDHEKWLPHLCYTHPRQPHLKCFSVEATFLSNGEVELGCPSCKSAGKSDVWARGKVTALSQFQMCNLRKHHQSESHQKSVAKFFGIEWSEFQAAFLDHDSRLTKSVPSAMCFAWAIHCARTATSHRRFKQWMEHNAMACNDTNHILQDQSRRVVRQMHASVSWADRSENCLPVLRSAVRISQACDDRDQNFSLRYRAVTLQPTIECHDRWGSLVRDPGFAHEDVCTAMVRSWMCPVLIISATYFSLETTSRSVSHFE